MTSRSIFENQSSAWDVILEDYRLGYAGTLAPLVVKDKVIVGISGGEYATRGFIDAYDAHSGQRARRYTCSLVALDADTGTLRCHYQFTPHDTHDWDSNHVPVRDDLTIRGEPQKVVMVANRNGLFYVLDRVTGRLLVAKPFTETRWVSEVGPDGRPIVLNEDSSRTCLPDQHGGRISCLHPTIRRADFSS